MTKGPAGYGRYDDDLSVVGCPYARTDRSECVARDGRTALDRGDRCRGCGFTPEDLAQELAGEYDPARELLPLVDPVTLADEFAEMVREMTEPERQER